MVSSQEQADLDKHYVLIRSGHRAGQKGTVWEIEADGTVEVAFKLDVGGGYETSYFLPSDLHDLGIVEECKIQQPGHDHLKADCPDGGEGWQI